MSERPEILFVCVHNAGRSQMAAALVRHYAGDSVRVRSAGTVPAAAVNPTVVIALREVGIDVDAGQALPKLLTDDIVEVSDIVITMGCGDTCPYHPGKRYEDWTVDDPAGQPLDVVRTIRDEIDSRVRVLLGQLHSATRTVRSFDADAPIRQGRAGERRGTIGPRAGPLRSSASGEDSQES